MMHEDVDDDDEEVILDQRTLIHMPNTGNTSSNSGPILLGVNRFNIKVYDDPIKLSKAQASLLAATCISIGMFTGLLGPTFPFLAQHMPTELPAVIWLIAMKAIGFLIGTLLSAYLYAWFNVCCLLGLSCLSISFGVCSLPFITDLTTFYLTSLILGTGLAISYNGIDALYNRLWTRPSSLASVRWLHLLVAIGAVLSTLMLFPSTISNDHQIESTKPDLASYTGRPRREIVSQIADRLASFASNTTDSDENFATFNGTKLFDRLNETLSTTTSTTLKYRLKPSVVQTDALAQTNVVKQSEKPKSDPESKPICSKSYCCYYRQNETLKNRTFVCRTSTIDTPPTDECKSVLNTCQTLTSQVCIDEKNHFRCRIDQICGNEQPLNCSIQAIEMIISTSSTTTTTTSTTTTSLSTTPKSTTTISTTTTSLSTTTSKSTTTIDSTTISSSTTISPTTVVTTTTARRTTSHRNKPPMAESDIDDRSENLFNSKTRSFFQSISGIHILYLLLALSFFLLGILYSVLAIRGDGGTNVDPSVASNIIPSSLFFGTRRRVSHASQPSLFADRAALKFVSLLVLFYFVLAGIEHSCTYLTFIFGIALKFSHRSSLFIQFLFILGLLFGRLFDILIDYGCLLFHTRLTSRTKKQSDRFHTISLKFCILIRLILLFMICSTLTFSHLFDNSSSSSSPSKPSIQTLYLAFFAIGFLLASLPTLILFWIERDLNLNDRLIRIVALTIATSELLFPPISFYAMQHAVLSFIFYLFVGTCFILIIFIFILYSSKQWQRKRLYRILPQSLEMNERQHGNDLASSDEEDNDGIDHTGYERNGRLLKHDPIVSTENERPKGFKLH